jgi:hypothetical protein
MEMKEANRGFYTEFVKTSPTHLPWYPVQVKFTPSAQPSIYGFAVNQALRRIGKHEAEFRYKSRSA